MTRRATLRAIAGLAIALCPVSADAHLNSTGMGPVYDGLLHFATSPEDLVPVLALALFAGLRGAGHGRRALFAAPGAWLLGGLLGAASAAAGASALFAPFWFLLLGGLLAADAKLSPGATAALAAALGLLHGYANGSGMGTSGSTAAALVGLVSGIFVLVAIAAAFAVSLRAAWARIAVRVAGSWIAASGLLLLGWAVRGRG